MESGADRAAQGEPISGFEASLEFSERGRPERGVMFETSRETKREIRDDVGLYIQVSGIADLRGVDRGRDAAVAVGRRRLRGGDRDQFERRRIEGEGACAHARNAAGIEPLRCIRTGGVRSLISQELLIVLVTPFEPRRQGDRTGQPANRPGVVHVEVEVVFLLHELAVVEAGRRQRAQGRVE